MTRHEPRRRTSGVSSSSMSGVGAAPHATALRALPAVESARQALLARLRGQGAQEPPSSAVTASVRAAISEARAAIRAGAQAPDLAAILDRAAEHLAAQDRPRLRPIINAAGAILHTNLGRAPLSARAIARIVAVASNYTNLEYDLERGERGSRQAHIRDLLRALTGAEDALAVNNNAAAALLILSALAAGREVIVSRGELVEIGGGFRVPDILVQSGARLVEVGTTNRVRLADYAAAITPETAAILSVHPSNFRIIGFTEAPDLTSLAALAHERQAPLIRDLGSGALLDTGHFGLAREDMVTDSLRAGVDVVCFSGDKLLGGPQAGVIAGTRALLERIERHPLMRAVRCDKLTLAALEATLLAYRDGVATTEIPIWRMMATPIEQIRKRATRWVTTLRAAELSAEVVSGETAIGGGSLPGETLPTVLCAVPAKGALLGLSGDEIEAFMRRLRLGDPPVLARVARDQVLFDPRTVIPHQDKTLTKAIIHAWHDHRESAPTT